MHTYVFDKGLTFSTLNIENARVMVLAATNRPQELDEAILRRLPQTFEIGIPDCGERTKILKVILKGERVEDSIDYDCIARLCVGYTGSDLLELCKQAAYFPVRDLLHEEKTGPASSSHVSTLFMFLHYSSCAFLGIIFFGEIRTSFTHE